MRKNGRIILFICITMFLLILGLFYLSYCNNYTINNIYTSNIVEKFSTSTNPYTDAIPYSYTAATAPQIYNDDVRKSNLAAIYDVDSTNVNLCYGNSSGNNSLYTFPYIILLLRAFYLQSRSTPDAASKTEYDHINTVLVSSEKYKKSNLSSQVSNLINYINANNIDKINEDYTGPRIITPCMRIYPNWLMNPTSGTYGDIDTSTSTDIFINNTQSNGTYKYFYINPGKDKPIRTNLQLSDNKIILPQQILDDKSIKISEGNTKPDNVNRDDKKQIYNISNKDYTNKDYESYCTDEWTQEFALANQINIAMNNNDICLKLLLNPFNGDILDCKYNKFNSTTLKFDDLDNNLKDIVSKNIIELYKVNDPSDKNDKYGIRKKIFNASINKYVFDYCGRLYAVPTSNNKFMLNDFDLTKIYYSSTADKDLSTKIASISSLLSGSTIDAYNAIDSSTVQYITKEVIDNMQTLHKFYKDIINDSFTFSKMQNLGKETSTNTFSSIFKNDSFTNIVKYTSSDGFVYINIGPIQDNINSNINTYIQNTITPNIINNFKNILMRQITSNSTLLNTLSERLQTYQTNIYNYMNKINIYIYNIKLITNLPKTVDDAVPIPLLNTSQITILQYVANSNGVGADSDYAQVQDLLIAEETNTYSDIIDIDKSNKLYSIYATFEYYIKSTTSGTNAYSLFTPYNLTKLQDECNTINYAIDGNKRSGPYGDNLYTGQFFISLICNSLQSLLTYVYNRQQTEIININRDLPLFLNAQRTYDSDNKKYEVDITRYQKNVDTYNQQNRYNPIRNTFWDWYWNWVRNWHSRYRSNYAIAKQPANQGNSGGGGSSGGGSSGGGGGVQDSSNPYSITAPSLGPDELTSVLSKPPTIKPLTGVNSAVLNTVTASINGKNLTKINNDLNIINKNKDELQVFNNILSLTSKIYGAL